MNIHHGVKHRPVIIHTTKWFIIWNFPIPLTLTKMNDSNYCTSKARAREVLPVWLVSVNHLKPKNDVLRHALSQLTKIKCLSTTHTHIHTSNDDVLTSRIRFQLNILSNRTKKKKSDSNIKCSCLLLGCTVKWQTYFSKQIYQNSSLN